MKNIDLYLLRTYIPRFFVILFLCIFFLLMQFLWKYVDDLVGKGLDVDQIFKLLFFASARFVPLALPLSILISSLMFYGNLGETNQINALKTCGISFLRMSIPLIIFITLVSFSSYLFSNYLLPIANLKNASMIYAIQKKKPAINIREGFFYDEINGLKIKIGKKHSDNENLEDIIIYYNKGSDNNNITIAKKGIMSVNEKKNLLTFTLIDGYTYNELNLLDKEKNEHRKISFKENKLFIDLSTFNFMKNTESLYKGHYAMLDNKHIILAVDSLKLIKKKKVVKFKNEITQNFKSHITHINTLKSKESEIAFLNERKIISTAINKSQALLSIIQSMIDEFKYRNTIITKHKIEFYRKFTLAFACILMFIIGSSIGSLINKGGFGYPILISCLFFVIYYIISIIGEKSAKELTVNAFSGMWLSNLVFAPISITLFIIANNEIKYIIKYK